MTDTAYERILDALRRHGSKVRANHHKASAQCPAHDDRQASLSVTAIEGQALVHCHAGCTEGAAGKADPALVLHALGLTTADLFDDKRNGVTYRYDNGRTVHRTTDRRFYQGNTTKPPELYHLSRLLDASDGGVFLCEGEKDVHAIESAGGIATCNPMGAKNFSQVDVTPLAGRAVTVVVDRDEAGDRWAADVRRALINVAGRLRFVRAANGKDAADHIAAAEDGQELHGWAAYDPPPTVDDEPPAVAQPEEVDGWTKPKPALNPPLPQFPTKLLPQVLRDMAEAVSAEVQAPTGMAGMLSLAVGASTLAGKVEVAGRPGHVEQLPLWVFVAADSAERKTPVFNLLRAPLITYEEEHERQNGLDRKRKQTDLKVLEGRLSAAEKTAIKNGMDNKLRTELDQIHEEMEDLRIPPRLQMWVSSPTPEAVHNLLSEHDGRMAVFSDEGGLFGIIAGRYAGKSGGADIDPFLSGFVGSPLRAPRVTAERKNVSAAFLTMGFAVQPSVLAELGGVAGAEEKGLIGRFLFALPESMIGDRMYGDSVPVPDEVSEAYSHAVLTVMAMPPRKQRARLLLDPDAYRMFSDFHDRTEVRMKPGGDLAGIKSWGGKIAGTTLRVAAVMHVYEHPAEIDRAISVETVSNAIELTEKFFIPHAFAAFRVLRHGAEKSVAHRVISWLSASKLASFTLRDAFRQLTGGGGGAVKSQDDVLPSLEFLAGEGYIRRVSGGRSDSIKYEVNPLWDFS